jgi:hypothetical protein
MRYHAPYGSINPDASYVDKDTAGAVRGSVPPAAAIEDPQREIVDVISKAGLTPGDGQQLALAIQSGAMNIASAGGSGAALTAVLAPAPAALTDGFCLTIIPTIAPLAGMTLDLNGLGAKPIKDMSGAANKLGDIYINVPITLMYSETLSSWVIVSTLPKKAAYFRMDMGSNSLVIPGSTVTTISNYANSESSLHADSTLNASAGTITIGASDAGVWSLSAAGVIPGSATTEETIILVQNATYVAWDKKAYPSGGSDLLDQSVTTIVRLAAGDVIKAAYIQVSASGSTSITSSMTYFAGVKIGD